MRLVQPPAAAASCALPATLCWSRMGSAGGVPAGAGSGLGAGGSVVSAAPAAGLSLQPDPLAFRSNKFPC